MVDKKVLEVKIDLDDDEKLNFGLKIDVIVLENNKENFLIPSLKTVINRDGMSFVKARKNGKYEEKRIITCLSDGENIEVSEGLK